MSVESAKAKLDAQPGDPATGYISKADHQDSYTELVDDTALTGATTAEALTISGTLNGRDPDNLVAGPGSSTDNALVRFDGTGGKTVQGSGITVDDSGKVTFGDVGASAGLELGSSGPRVMSGTGSPEGVVTAPVGSMWTDEAATTGAIKWIKVSGTGNTGWVVEYGDTGWRDVSALLVVDATRTDAEFPRVRRVKETIVFQGVWRNSGTPFRSQLLTLPVGFRPTLGLYVHVPYDDAVTAHYRNFKAGANGSLSYGGPAMDGSNFEYYATWVTNEAWPSSLPGSAA